MKYFGYLGTEFLTLNKSPTLNVGKAILILVFLQQYLQCNFKFLSTSFQYQAVCNMNHI